MNVGYIYVKVIAAHKKWKNKVEFPLKKKKTLNINSSCSFNRATSRRRWRASQGYQPRYRAQSGPVPQLSTISQVIDEEQLYYEDSGQISLPLP